jgi:Holliday junction resolvase RusA-like endonuclease
VGVGLTPRAKQYKKDVGWEAKAAGIRMMEGDVSVNIELFVGNRHIDTDNVLKMLMDALTGIAWEDDKQVAEIHIKRRRCRKREAAHMEVMLTPTGKDEGRENE